MKKLFGLLMFIITLLMLSIDVFSQTYDVYGREVIKVDVTVREDPMKTAADIYRAGQENTRAIKEASDRRWEETRAYEADLERQSHASKEAEKQRQHELELARIAAGQGSSSNQYSGSSPTYSEVIAGFGVAMGVTNSSTANSAKKSDIRRYYGIYYPIKDGKIVYKDSSEVNAWLDVTNWRFGLVNMFTNRFMQGHPFDVRLIKKDEQPDYIDYYMQPGPYRDEFAMRYGTLTRGYVSFGSFDKETNSGWIFIVRDKLQ